MTHVITWPRLIGGAVATFGLGCLMYAIANSLGRGLATHLRLDLIDPAAALFLVVGVILLALSYPLCRGRDWARRVLFAALLLVCVGLVVACLPSIVYRTNLAIDGDASRITGEQLAEIRLQKGLIHLSNAGISICVVGLPGFLALALLHPDVVGAFRGRVTETSNQAMQRTADRPRKLQR